MSELALEVGSSVIQDDAKTLLLRRGLSGPKLPMS